MSPIPLRDHRGAHVAQPFSPQLRGWSLAWWLSAWWLLGLWLLASSSTAVEVADLTDLEAGFRRPPDSARPWVYWWWLDGHVNPRGITRDLEEMKRQGINGVLIFNAGGAASPMGLGVQFLSPDWEELFKHALREAARLGMEVSLNLCDGWTCGGARINADEANKKLVYAETQVEGPGWVSRALPTPPTMQAYYRDVAVIALPRPPGQPVAPAGVSASSTEEGYCGEWNHPPEDVLDGDPDTYWSCGAAAPTPVQPAWLTFEYHEALPANALWLVPAAANGPREGELQAAGGEGSFTTVCRFTLEPGKPARVAFNEVKSKTFRLIIRAAHGVPLHLADAVLLRKQDEPRPRRGVPWWWFKSGNRSLWDWPRQGPAVLRETRAGDGAAADCRAGEVLDLTSRLDTRGRLEWNAPAGAWTVLRFGYTLEGQQTRATCANIPNGPEADMLSSQGLEAHFRHVAEPVLAAAAAIPNHTLKYLHIDSYELGADVRGQQPTWTAAFRDEFKARRGYDPLPYLPALARRVVDGQEITERFLWDFRRTIGDLIADRFWKRFAELAHARGLGVHMETGYGTYPFPHIDGLQCAGWSDIPMGEFWHGTDIMSQFNPWGNVIRTVASAAHVYGHRLVQAESFTSWNHWMESPQSLKAVGDTAFCDGVNRMVLHQYTHQQWIDKEPGSQYGAGTHFDRNVTWWAQSRPFFDYLARCQFLLQQGRFVADVCWFYGEGVTTFVPSREHLRPALPAGYDFDAVNADVLLNRLSFRDGRLVLPDGPSYRLLVLPEEGTLSPVVLRKIRALVADGASVLGPRPHRAPGLGGWPHTDEEVRALAAELWGGEDTHSPGEHRFGNGRVLWGQPLSEALRQGGIDPDFSCPELEPSGAGLNFIHRAAGDTDLYFIANSADSSRTAACSFRMTGRQPEIWDPVTGETRDATDFKQIDGRTSVRLEFAPYGSMFIVFRKPARDNLGSRGRNFPGYQDLVELAGPWTVAFLPRWGGPESATFTRLESWSRRPEPGIRFYSGSATYRQTFDLPPATASADAEPRKLALELGEVREIASVRLNGQDLGVLWTKPFRADITAVVRPTGNLLEVQVANLWPNRMIGNASLPSDQRFGQTNVRFDPKTPLLESGLLGPVRVQVQVPAR